MNEETHQPAAKEKSNTAKYIGIGCLVIVLIGAVVSFLAVTGIKKLVTAMVDEYTAEQSVTLPGPPGNKQSAQDLITRVDEFSSGLNSGKSVAPMVLTADDINLLINFHPGWKEMAGKIFISMDKDKLSGEVSLPIGELIPMPMLEGRYLNGSVTLSVELKNDRFLVFLEAIEANGKAVPEEAMKQFRSENLAKEINKNPDMKGVFEKLESINVKDGKMHLVPKNSSGADQ